MIVFLGLLAGFSGSIGISAIIPLFYLLSENSNTEPTAITLLMKDFFSFFHIPFSLSLIMILIASLLIFKAVIQFYAKHLNNKISSEYEATIRTSLLKRTLLARWPYLLNQKSGYLERIILHDVSQGATLISLCSNFILFSTSFLAYAIVAFNISATVTMLTLSLGIILFIFSKPMFAKAKKMGRQMADFEKEVAHRMSQSLVGVKTIKGEGVESDVIEESTYFFQKLKQLKIKMGIYQNSLNLAFEPIGFLFIAALFIFYYRLPNFDLISFGAVVYLVQKMFSFIQSAQNNIHRINEVSPYVEAVIDYREQSAHNAEKITGVPAPKFVHELAFRDVEFYYDEARPLLSKINLSIKKGHTIGIIGVSGAGKTTLVDLLLGFFRPIRGEISLDGKNMNYFDIKSWRQKFSYVSQEVFLLNDTIGNNIRFYDSSISDQAIIDAAKAAHINDFVQGLPAGFETMVGERGLKISGGQRQRIALARALANKPEILILDEATSSLDLESEALIKRSLDFLKGKITIITIAHRLATVMDSDRLIVLENGSVVEEGAPKELLENKNSHFYKMHQHSTK